MSGPDVRYKWEQSHIGGGGYITGLLQHPQNPFILYARCDVAGVFRSMDRGKGWNMINRGMEECHHHSVQSFAISPHNPMVLFRCSGEARGGRIFGSIHKSTDGGDHWYEVCQDVDFYGNGPTRMNGEVVAFDPYDPDYVIVGGYSKGVYTSKDGGESFYYTGLRGERISCVAFHPAVPGRVYAGTIGDFGLARMEAETSRQVVDNFLKRLQDRSRGRKGRLYISEDGGRNWRCLQENLDIAELAFNPDEPDIVYAACVCDGIIKSVDGGTTFERKHQGLPGGFPYHTLAVDPSNPSILYTAPDIKPPHNGELPPVPVYRSADGGETWSLICRHTSKDLKNYPDYMTAQHVGWAIAKVRVDWQSPNILYMTNWYGVSVSEDGGHTWSGNNFAGMETTCVEDIIFYSGSGGKVYFVAADHGPNVSEDGGQSFSVINRVKGYSASSAIVVSRFNPQVILYGGVFREAGKCCLARSGNGGKYFKPVLDLNKGLFVQALAEDYFEKGTFYAYIDGPLEEGAGLYKSEDWGSTWIRMPVKLPEHIVTLPHEKHWIEAELLSVVVYQVKNVCGANKLLCTDPHHPKTLYMGEWTDGLYKVTDEGNTWKNIGDGLPFKKTAASVLNVIKVDEKKPGVLYAGFIREGLWRSEDGGETWDKIFPQDNSCVNVSGLAVGGVSGEEIVIASEPLYWSRTKSAVYYSRDWGQTWSDITDYGLGAIRWKGIALDSKSHTIYAASCGNGCFVAHPVQP